MLRLIAFLAAVALVAAGLAWLADNPGDLVLDWQGYHIEATVFVAIVILVTLVAVALLCWSIIRNIWYSPAAVGSVLSRRRQKLGLDALSSGMIALGAGDKAAATRAAIQARRSLPNEPLTHLLRAQAAQLTGDRTTARRIFEAMLASPDTEQLGLRGLFLEAQRERETEAAQHFAERAVALNPKLAWAVDALFDLQCREGDWPAALDTLAVARKNGHLDRTLADRRRAVLLTAQAQAAEEADPERALTLALEAHGLASDLVPAAAIAGRLLAARGNTPRAAKVLQRTWSRAPHPDLATAYAYARIGDSPRDRLDRVRQLAALSPNSIESPIAVANAAIEAHQYDEARAALEPLIPSRMTQRVATLMARIEGEQHADKGRVREWLARTVNAPRDPAWTADGFVADRWMPVSPVSGALDAFQWRVPVEAVDKSEGEALTSKIEELVALGMGPAAEPQSGVDAPDVTPDGHKEPRGGGTSAQPDRSPSKIGKPEVEDIAASTAAKRQRTDSRPSEAVKHAQPRRPADSASTHIFVSPPSPDDPGAAASEAESGNEPLQPQRA